MVRVLGIDCGSAATGYGVIASDGHRHRALACGTIRPPRSAAGPAARLQWIHEKLTTLMSEQAPDWVAVEDAFYAKNVRSALRLSEVRGVALQAAAARAIPVASYTPLAVKAAVTGYGRADKAQVRFMVAALLAMSQQPDSLDASDALAVAICHLHTHGAGAQPARAGRAGAGT